MPDLEEQNARLRGALAFYADADHYGDDYGCGDPGCCESGETSVEEDEGRIARAALGIPEPVKEVVKPKVHRVKTPCMTGDHRYHWSYDAQRQCQRDHRHALDAGFAERYRRFQEACDAFK
jgi:hypothetical protein